MVTTLLMMTMGSTLATSECTGMQGCLIVGCLFVKYLIPLLPSLPRWFSIVLYLTFLFAVIVVLLNLLIAQMSDTYAKVQEDVEGTFAIARARIIARLQKGKWLLCKEVKIHHCTCRCVYPYAYVYSCET